MATLAPPAVVAPARRKASRLWWRVHQWAGLKLSLMLAFVMLTGTLATLAHEIDWLLQPSLRVTPSSVEGPVAWDRIAANAAAHSATARITGIEAPTAPFFAARVMIERRDGRLGFLHAHPTTGAIQGEGPWVGAQRVLRNTHRHLNLPTWLGVPLVSALALPLLVSLGTAFIVYKRWWRGFLKPVRWRDARTAMGDLHRLLGVWSLWFVALIALTSLWYLVESLGGDAPPAPRAEITATERAPAELGALLGPSLAAARAADPELRIHRIGFPGEGSGAFVFQGQRDAVLVRPRANAVWVDAATARVALVTDGSQLSAHQRISEAADPLHFGTFGGYWTKLAWFLFGLALTGLSVSGAAVYALRLARERREHPGTRGVLARIWTGMGAWRWWSIAAVATAFVLLPALFFIPAE